ncbi:DnaQ family exonuclease/DinG family helicase [Thermincola ferriacetica]|uniref:3'-5' exonuclease DinG n=1 Tax=Thermincola ferriacetica TaxID=281456 RepID=A0A0L6W596_9FIRM|nr:helicase C-terminal domain-containing protein [Thermincola ferriacetica]KNZ70269.1 DnaQ family exonuclease/DinG family helicase [Thermincola ferriacetica]
MSKNTFVAVDIETTGLNPADSEIIEVAAVRFAEGRVLETFQSLVKPEKKIPLKIQQLTGINESMVADAPACAEVTGMLAEFVHDSIIIGHNIGFDLNFLQHYHPVFIRAKYYDTLPLARLVWPKAHGYRLANLVEALKIQLNGSPHRAFHDALAAKEVFCLALEVLRGLGTENLLRMLEIIGAKSDWPYYEIISALALQGAGQAKKGYSYPFLAGLLEGKKEFASLFPNADSAENSPVDAQEELGLSEEDLSAFFGPEGRLGKVMPNYQYRPQQVQMLKEILHCFKSGLYAVIEAGTGTGKSLAYLLPALYWNKSTGAKVVVSTHTINLQEQLWNQDIPNLERVIGAKINAALVKGRTNYLCLRKWDQRIKDRDWSGDREINFYLRILIWLNETATGDKTEINLQGEEQEYWRDVCGDPDACLGTECRWFNRGCFVMQAKRRAEAADLLIVNHSLVFADMKSENNVLPDYKYIIIDEAHHIEDSATDYLGYEVSFAELQRLLRILKKDRRGGRFGLIARMKDCLSQILQGHNDLLRKATELLEGIITTGKEVELTGEDFAERARIFASRYGAEEDETEQTVRVVRIKDYHLQDELWQSVLITGENLSLRLDRLSGHLDKVLSVFFSEEMQEESRETAALAREAKCLAETLKNKVKEIKFILNGSEPNYVYWLETNETKSDAVILKAAPINIGNLLWEKFFREKNSVVLTSATLSVDGSFSHFLGKIGLNLASEESLRLLHVAAPFNYEKQALLCVINDLPSPGEVEDMEFAGAIAPVLAQIARILNGRTLCLFTSHRLLRKTYDLLVPLLEKEGITVLGHNIDGGRRGLVEEFKKNGKSLLLGASSFWEGVDIPGDLLSCVVIVKMPFSPPNIPTLQARVEKLASDNVDGFYSYSVPQAVIKFKQGFGRLIRKENDTGVVIVLDKRIVQKKYGKVFLRSLPVKRHFKGDRYAVMQKIRDWMAGERPDIDAINYVHDFNEINQFLKQRLKKKETM